MANFLDQLSSILFLDIETASLTERFEDLHPRLQEEWIRKEKFIQLDTSIPGDLYFERAGIHAEFGKIICIGVGYFQWKKQDKKLQYHSKVFGNETENELLLDFSTLLNKKKWNLCAHNGKEFDFPYICRRMLINGIPLPEPLQISGKKPWEIRHLDTLELWKFGDYKHYTRLELLASIFGIHSSKEGIDGSQVNAAFYIEKNLEKIKKYCLRDVEVTAQVFLAMNPQAEPIEIQFTEEKNLRKDPSE